MADIKDIPATCAICGAELGTQIAYIKEELKHELIDELEVRAAAALRDEMYKIIGEHTVDFGKAITIKVLLSLIGLVGIGVLAWWKGNTEALKILLGP